MAGPSFVNQCSVGVHLNSPCYLKRFEKKTFELDTVDDLFDNTRKTVELRVNMSHVSSTVAFSTRLSLYHQSVRICLGNTRALFQLATILSLLLIAKTLLPKNLIFTFIQANVFCYMLFSNVQQ
jgi:hypothetical protein